MYKINFTVGDWSNDGHGQKESFIVNSSVDVKMLRELHYKAEEYLGFDVGDICKECDVSNLSETQSSKLKELGLWENYMEEYLNADEVMEIWLKILRYVAKQEKMDLELYYMPPKTEKIPTMHFYGYDDKNRHLNVPGCGVFIY